MKALPGIVLLYCAPLLAGEEDVIKVDLTAMSASNAASMSRWSTTMAAGTKPSVSGKARA